MSDAASTILVPASHYGDFLDHPGMWAVFDDPKLHPGDAVRFVLPGGSGATRELTATVLECHRIDGIKDNEWLHRGTSKSLVGWWRVTYEGWFVAPVADWGEGGVPTASEVAASAERLAASLAEADAKWGRIKSVSTGDRTIDSFVRASGK